MITVLASNVGACETSPAKRTAADMKALRTTIVEIADEIREDATITLRQLYYAATVRGILPKTEAAYKRLAAITADLRRSGALPYAWIEDGTRVTYAPTTYESARAALEGLAERYLESPWVGAAIAPEVWLEKDALSGVVYDVTYDYCVPLRVQRGYASLSALYKAARDIAARWRRNTETQVYYLRDLDPSGADAARAAEETVRAMVHEMAPAAHVPPFRILGVTPEQVKQLRLPTRPNKVTDSRSAAFAHETSVELDAIEPNKLRALVTDAIMPHMPEAARLAHEAQMETTRAFFFRLAKKAATA